MMKLANETINPEETVSYGGEKNLTEVQNIRMGNCLR